MSTVPGEEIRVVGNHPSIGNWDPNNGEKLVTSKKDYPVWKTKENIKVEQDTEIEYKYTIFKNGKFERWENLPSTSNRNLIVKNMIRIVINDKEESIDSTIEKFTPIEITQESILEEAESEFPYPEEDVNRFELNEQLKQKNYLGVRERDFYDKLLMKNTYIYKENTFVNIPSVVVKEEEDYKDLNYQPEEDFVSVTNKSTVEEQELNNKDKIIICSLYLPLSLVSNKANPNEWELQLTNDPLYNTLYKILKERENVYWIGLLKNYHKIKNENELDSIVGQLHKKYKMIVLKLDENSCLLLEKFFSTIMEPLFHYITIFYAINQIEEFENMWKTYKFFNELVSKTVGGILEKNNDESFLVFLNDYHFLLAPSYIYNLYLQNYKKNKKVSVGLFLHSPFPSHDIYRRFPFREEILKSIMNCSLIGFHNFDSSRNFLTSCKRLLSIDSMSILKGELALSYFGRKVILRVKHVSSTPNLIKEEMNLEIFKNLNREILNKNFNKYIFVSVDNLLFLPGIIHKLQAYKRFLREIGENYKQNVLLQYIDTTDEDTANKILDLQIQKQIILDLVKSIHKEFGESVLQIVEKNITYTERLAILASGKCYVKCTKRESFSLDIYEFLNLKILNNDTNEIGYILSELSGVTSNLSAAIKINPFDIESIRKGFETAFQIHFDREKISDSQEKDLMHVKKNNTVTWLYLFLKDLKNAFDIDDDSYYLGSGFRLNLRLIKISSNFQELDRALLYKNYENSIRRLILLDYEGTLPSLSNTNCEYESKGLQPCPKILNTLEYLTRDKRNTVFIVTGREAKLVSEWFSDVPNLGLASEHGFLYRYSSNNKAKNLWEKMIKGFDGDWRANCIEQLVSYTQRCEGSFIEVKESSVVWQYRDCDSELGKSFANVITSDFEKSLKNLQLNVINGKGYVEVNPIGINKGAFASLILKQEIKRKRAPDFIFAIGDDTSDEQMFNFFKEKTPEIKKYIKNPKIYTVTVGRKPSKANSFVDSISDVSAILKSFMQISNRKSSSNSSMNLHHLKRSLISNIESLSFNESSTTLSKDKIKKNGPDNSTTIAEYNNESDN